MLHASPMMEQLDIVKIWGNLLANGGTSICAIPTTYFMQGVQVFAYANEATTSSIESDESSNPNCNPINNELQLEEEEEEEQEEDDDDASCDLKDDNANENENDIKDKYIKRRRRIQRIRYSREEYKCSMCTYTCTTEKAYLRHLRGCEATDKDTGSNIEPRLSCPICGKDRNDEQTILTHMKKHKDDKYFCCDICKFKTLQLKKLIQHRRMHTGEKPHLCPFCTYRSARRDNLRSHVRRVHKKDNLTCDTFTPRSMLLTPTKVKDTE